MRDIRLQLEPTSWEESWLVADVSASSLLSLSLRENAFFKRLQEQGKRVHRLRLDASTPPHPDSLPPEFVGGLVAPFYAQALDRLSVADKWVILIESLMSVKPWRRAFPRIRSVKIWASEPPPANRLIFEVAQRNLSRISHYLWGDGTEIYLVPFAESNSPVLLQIFNEDISLSRVQVFLLETPLLVGIFRDATVFEIVSHHTTEMLRLQMRLGEVNQSLQEFTAENLILIDRSRQTYPVLERMFFEQVDTYIMRRRDLLCPPPTTAVERAVVAGRYLGQDRFELLLRYEYTRYICWFLVWIRLEPGVVSFRRFLHLSTWGKPH